jgi:hypothetical protein
MGEQCHAIAGKQAIVNSQLQHKTLYKLYIRRQTMWFLRLQHRMLDHGTCRKRKTKSGDSTEHLTAERTYFPAKQLDVGITEDELKQK